MDIDLPTVITVHDLSVLLHPEWHPPRRVAEFERAFADTLKRARHLLAISEFGKSEIVRHLGWPADRVSVTHMGVRPGLRPVTGGELARGLAALNLSPGYLLHVGTLEPRKNLEMLVRAYCGLPAAVRERHPLVLAGGRGWKCGELHDFLTREGRAKNVRWLGYVAEEHFAALYSGARALAFPSFYEGFGMPAVEAMACGTAVLASTAGAVAEVAGARACLTDPADEAGWRDAMLRACADGGWLASLREGAEAHAAPFTWRACAEGTLRAYRTALAQPEARKAA
jgi:alpha-1,3-rhamnosyl/mannosyltransferase